MASMRMLAALFALVAPLVALQCAATPFTVRLGVEKIVLDTPPGFSDTGDLASPRLNDLAATLTSASNRILLFALSDADFRKFTQGDQLDWNRYMIAVTPKGLENVRVTPEQFARFVSDSVKGLGQAEKPADLIAFLDKQPEGKVNLLEEERPAPAVVTALQAGRLPPLPGETFWQSGKPQYLFYTTTLFLVRGRALQLSVYLIVVGKEQPDLVWLKNTSQRWREEILRLNK
jgi:hypothetical protein